MKLEIDNCYNLDCLVGMQMMKEQGIKADLCIADPPYSCGIKDSIMKKGKDGKRYGKAAVQKRNYEIKNWDDERIGGGYFDIMREVATEQIIFGGNYYTDYLPPTKSWLVWNKRSISETDRNDFGDCELAWCSTGVARVINFMYNGMLQDDIKNKHYDRFHPTEKPVGMYIKLLNLYTKKGDLILDPFAGSQSLRIACHKLQRHYIGFELDEEYYEKGTKWFEQETSQISFWDM